MTIVRLKKCYEKAYENVILKQSIKLQAELLLWVAWELCDMITLRTLSSWQCKTTSYEGIMTFLFVCKAFFFFFLRQGGFPEQLSNENLQLYYVIYNLVLTKSQPNWLQRPVRIHWELWGTVFITIVGEILCCEARSHQDVSSCAGCIREQDRACTFSNFPCMGAI